VTDRLFIFSYANFSELSRLSAVMQTLVLTFALCAMRGVMNEPQPFPELSSTDSSQVSSKFIQKDLPTYIRSRLLMRIDSHGRSDSALSCRGDGINASKIMFSVLR
jgi:hypothetical protein